MKCEFCAGEAGEKIYTKNGDVKSRVLYEEQLISGVLQVICNQCIAKRFLIAHANELEEESCDTSQ